MPSKHKVPVAERTARICRMLRDRQSVVIGELAEQFGVSEMTVRRDLDKLERSGAVRRVHGGAMVAERMIFEFDFAARRNANRRAKEAVAREAFKLIQPGWRIILDTGTTTLELACLLAGLKDLTVITPSLAVASQLQFSEGIQTILLGGVIRRGSPDLTGTVTETVLEMFAADVAFQGADGIGLDGALYNADMRISRVDRKIRERAARTYVLADSTKVGRTALVRHSFLQQVDALITDDGIDPEHKRQLEQLGAKIIVVHAKAS